MPTTTDVRVNDLIINKMTQEQYDALQDKSPTELYVVEGDSNLIYAEQAVELPTASESNLGKIYQYTGETDTNYTNGYFYKCMANGTEIVSGTASVEEYINAEGNTPDPENIPIFIFNKEVFDEYIRDQGKPANTGTKVKFSYWADPDEGYALVKAEYNSEDFVLSMVINDYGSGMNETLAKFGFTTNFCPVEKREPTDEEWNIADQQMFDGGYIIVSLPTNNTYAWNQIDVQPVVDPLPDQTGQSGKFLTTDGTDASWSNQLDGNLDIISNSGLRVKRIDNSSVFHLYLTAGVQKAETEFRVGQGSSSNPWSTSANFILGYDGRSSGARTSTFYATGNSVDIKNLGGLNNKWTSVYTTKINNGADIIVPTTGGTLALLSDIPADPLPSQTGNTGKILGTDGTNAAWETKTTVSFRTWDVNE